MKYMKYMNRKKMEAKVHFFLISGFQQGLRHSALQFIVIVIVRDIILSLNPHSTCLTSSLLCVCVSVCL